jgi:hypothetical protein
MRMGNAERVFGYAGAKWMEAMQSGYHLVRDRYLAYAPPGITAQGRTAMLLGAAFDAPMRQAAVRFARNLLQHPADLVRSTYAQSILIIQPIDLLADGAQSMCDGCPDVTVHDGKLVWSCRLEELRNFGVFVRTVPKHSEEQRMGEVPAAAQ